ncbi:hypothetical protein [uncultured Draconibacterium sp.]|uniref:hypothetical protein n=1 Tax=uncultured Draconibacterium sp. TaxID=1573823 RepID=UPI002AA641D3|nr:hypothetical protein [uncultured Draconibacterium sp.]
MKYLKSLIFILCALFPMVVHAQQTKRSNQLLTPFRPMLATEISQISYEDLDGDGDPDILKTKMNDNIPVMWIDDDDDMKFGDLEGDLDSDCMMIDKNRDSNYGHAHDFIVDFGDEDGDGDADIQVVVDNADLSQTSTSFPGHYMIVVDTDDDEVFNYINWNVILLKCWEKYGHSHFFEDYHGQSLFLKAHTSTFNINDLRMNWENPFLFFDPDSDNISEYAIRLCDTHIDINGIPPHSEDGEIKDSERGVRFDGTIDHVDISFDLDNDNAPGNEFDFDMSFRFMGKGFDYQDQKNVFKSLKGLDGTDKYFYDKRWRNNDVLLFPNHNNAYKLVFNKGEWDFCWFTFDEDDDCARWERVELYEPLDLFKIGQNNGGLDNNRQADASGDRGEFDQDNSGKGRLYVANFDGRIHLFGAEWGAWRIDQNAKYYQGYGGIYNGTNLRDQEEPEIFATVKYEDTDGNGFLDKIMYDLDGDTIFEEKVLLKEFGIDDRCKVIETENMNYEDYHNLFLNVADDMWEQALLAIKIAQKYNLNTAWYSNLIHPNSIHEKYNYAYWLNFYIHMDLINLANLKNDPDLKYKIKQAYYSQNWSGML